MSGLTQRELESYLWGAATLLRGLIDASDYKQYIFPLLFFKRLSDVWDGDYQQALDETDDEGYATDTANDRFVIPEGAHWNDVRAAPRDVGRALLSAFLAIEAANPERLQGVFGNANWTDKAQMPDSTLKNLIEHFSKHDLTLAAVPEDELGNGYEYLIKKSYAGVWVTRPNQAARFSATLAATPSVNVTPSMTKGNWFAPFRRRHVLAAA